MSGVPLQAASKQTFAGFALVPKPAVKGVLFDHLVGERGQFVWNGETKRAGGLEIDHELEPGRLLDRQVGGALHP
jgi:hypothetical protein